MTKLLGVLLDVDRSIEAWLHSLLPGVSVRFGAPVSGAYENPTLALHLHAVRQDADSGGGWEELRDIDGMLAGRMPPDRRYRLVYLVTAWAADVALEHEMLGHFLVAGAVTPELPEAHLRGALVDETRPILMHIAPTEPLADPAALWAAWQIPPRAVLDFSLLIPLPRVAITDLSPPPSEIDMRSERRAPAAAGLADRPGGAPRRRPAVSR